MKDSYVVIQSFMVDELGLKGNELIVYAVIHGYTQDGEHWYYGTRGHLAEWCGATKGTVGNCLRSLCEKGYIEKREVEHFGTVRTQYRATRKIDRGVSKIDKGGIKNCNTPLPKIDPINNKEEDSKEYNKNIGSGFAPPTIAEVREYVKNRGYHFSADSFYDYYDSSGWRKANGSRVKNWKQCCATWENTASKSKTRGVQWDAELEELAGQLGF